MSKVYIGHDGKLVPYGLDGEKARNYIKHGLYVSNDDPRLRPAPKRWWQRFMGMFR